ncbi:MAG: UDP-N-acetylmuramate dehydrogenase [Desulfobacterales bacterium]
MGIADNFTRWLNTNFKGRVWFMEPMSKHTYFKIGGPAEALVNPESKDDVICLVKEAIQNDVPWLVIGGGTNLIVKDSGIKGIVIKTMHQKERISVETFSEDCVKVTASAGTRLGSLCRYTFEQGLQGMVFAVGIPGTVGGAIMMNAGTGSGVIQDVLSEIEVLLPEGSIRRFQKDDCLFSYRSFHLKKEKSSDGCEGPVILEGVFELRPGDREAIKKEAASALAERQTRQPSGSASAGCFFKNPSPENPAGKLIDLAGFKGYRVGGAVVSEKHANFIVNSGTATSEDVLKLSEIIQKKVFEMFEIELEPEVRIVG